MEEKILIRSTVDKSKNKLAYAGLLYMFLGVAILIFDIKIVMKTDVFSRWFFLIIAIVNITIGLISFVIMCAYESNIIVSNVCVYGKTSGHTTSLPLDSISSVCMQKQFNAVSIATSSGNIRFLFIGNSEEICSVINNLIMERQKNERSTEKNENPIHMSSADELKKYKDLLDSGVISQEEFNAKKNQLLGISSPIPPANMNTGYYNTSNTDWKCSNCGQTNGYNTSACIRCGKPKENTF